MGHMTYLPVCGDVSCDEDGLGSADGLSGSC